MNIMEEKNFEERIINMNRVSKKTKGGNTLSFTALAVVGDKKGKVGVGYGKARTTRSAIEKAISRAKDGMIEVKMKGQTIAHPVEAKYSAAKIILKPAPKGSGIIAGGPVRSVIELSGIQDISSKMLGSSNKVATVRCVIKALEKLRI